MDKEMKELAKELVNLHKVIVQQTLLIVEPEVERIIKTKSKDINAIEHALDALCEVAFDTEVLLLFKNLCRNYYSINPLATKEQIHFYRYLWGSDKE